MAQHRRLDPYARSLEAARELARGDPRNRALLEARSLAEYAPRALLYPLHVENLILVVAFGLAQSFIDALLPDLWLAKILPCALVVFLLEVVSHTAQGFGAPPRFTVAHLVSVAGRALVAIGLAVAAAFSLDALAGTDRHGLSLAAFAAWSLVLPAQFGLLAVGAEVGHAFDPRRWWGCLVAGGAAYAILAVLTAATLAGAAGVTPAWQGALDRLPRFGLVALDLLQVYAFFAAAHLIGAAFHIRREALGLATTLRAKTTDEEDRESLQESVARLLALADLEEHHNRHEAAVALLATAPIGSHAPRPWLEELFEGACRRPKPYFAEAAGQRLVALLVADKQWVRALEVVVHAAQRWPRFQPASRDERVMLAELAFDRGASLAFRQLTERLDDLGDAPQRVELGLLAARWRAEREGDAAGAIALLAPLLARREHPAHRRVAALHAALSGAAPR